MVADKIPESFQSTIHQGNNPPTANSKYESAGALYFSRTSLFNSNHVEHTDFFLADFASKLSSEQQQGDVTNMDELTI